MESDQEDEDRDNVPSQSSPPRASPLQSPRRGTRVIKKPKFYNPCERPNSHPGAMVQWIEEPEPLVFLPCIYVPPPPPRRSTRTRQPPNYYAPPVDPPKFKFSDEELDAFIKELRQKENEQNENDQENDQATGTEAVIEAHPQKVSSVSPKKRKKRRIRVIPRGLRSPKRSPPKGMVSSSPPPTITAKLPSPINNNDMDATTTTAPKDCEEQKVPIVATTEKEEKIVKSPKRRKRRIRVLPRTLESPSSSRKTKNTTPNDKTNTHEESIEEKVPTVATTAKEKEEKEVVKSPPKTRKRPIRVIPRTLESPNSRKKNKRKPNQTNALEESKEKVFTVAAAAKDEEVVLKSPKRQKRRMRVIPRTLQSPSRRKKKNTQSSTPATKNTITTSRTSHRSSSSSIAASASKSYAMKKDTSLELKSQPSSQIRRRRHRILIDGADSCVLVAATSPPRGMGSGRKPNVSSTSSLTRKRTRETSPPQQQDLSFPKHSDSDDNHNDAAGNSDDNNEEWYELHDNNHDGHFLEDHLDTLPSKSPLPKEPTTTTKIVTQSQSTSLPKNSNNSITPSRRRSKLRVESTMETQIEEKEDDVEEQQETRKQRKKKVQNKATITRKARRKVTVGPDQKDGDNQSTRENAIKTYPKSEAKAFFSQKGKGKKSTTQKPKNDKKKVDGGQSTVSHSTKKDVASATSTTSGTDTLSLRQGKYDKDNDGIVNKSNRQRKTKTKKKVPPKKDSDKNVKKKKGKRKTGSYKYLNCGTCLGCLISTDCGRCKPCLDPDKSSFIACVERKCLTPIPKHHQKQQQKPLGPNDQKMSSVNTKIKTTTKRAQSPPNGIVPPSLPQGEQEKTVTTASSPPELTVRENSSKVQGNERTIVNYAGKEDDIDSLSDRDSLFLDDLSDLDDENNDHPLNVSTTIVSRPKNLADMVDVDKDTRKSNNVIPSAVGIPIMAAGESQQLPVNNIGSNKLDSHQIITSYAKEHPKKDSKTMVSSEEHSGRNSKISASRIVSMEASPKAQNNGRQATPAVSKDDTRTVSNVKNSMLEAVTAADLARNFRLAERAKLADLASEDDEEDQDSGDSVSSDDSFADLIEVQPFQT